MKTLISLSPRILVPFKDQLDEGIFALFHNICSESDFEKLIQISASSFWISSHPPKNTFIWNSDYFQSSNPQNSWVLLQFFNFKVSMTGYRIIARDQAHRFTGWKIEILKYQNNWVCVDEKGDELNNSDATKSIQMNKTDLFSFIRITHTKPRPDNNSYFQLKGFEIFGEIIFK
jgi:hypothetical protein